ncbi:pseudouridine synthase [uncultured Desulfovibrio sp.]|uniref:pseudouridine synthase n=1 Tax=uncultured Desulfovibrio sp. TaxID=167968 RepID=UPI0026DC21D9|nr:pseudouridine synthase [uncultured Desulfovibrio sp.]
MGYCKAVFIGLDQLINALFGGWPDETISSRAWRWELAGVRSWPRKLLDGLALILGDKDHCRESFESERLGRQLPPELR